MITGGSGSGDGGDGGSGAGGSDGAGSGAGDGVASEDGSVSSVSGSCSASVGPVGP